MDDPRPGDPNANPNRPQNPAGPQAGRPQQPQSVSGVMPSTGVMVGSSGYPTQQAQAWSPPPGVYTPPQPAVQSVILAPMDYALYYPRELHAPNLAVDRPGPTRKAVIKVSAELF